MTVVALTVVLAGCGKKETTQTQAPGTDSTVIGTGDRVGSTGPGSVGTAGRLDYQDWESYTHDNVKMIYPPYHPLKPQIPSNAEAFARALKSATQKMGMPPVTDTLVVIYYTGFGQGRELTGHEFPYAESDTVHIWLPSFPGPPLMQWLLPKWSPVAPKYPFLRHGLIAMFDLSGQNYHQATHLLLDSNQFISLRRLVVDTAVNSNTERLQTAEAASFVAFLMAYKGPNGLKQMYESDLPFDSLMRVEFGTAVDTVQAIWLTFAKKNVPAELTAKGGTRKSTP